MIQWVRRRLADRHYLKRLRQIVMRHPYPVVFSREVNTIKATLMQGDQPLYWVKAQDFPALIDSLERKIERLNASPEG